MGLEQVLVVCAAALGSVGDGIGIKTKADEDLFLIRRKRASKFDKQIMGLGFLQGHSKLFLLGDEFVTGLAHQTHVVGSGEQATEKLSRVIPRADGSGRNDVIDL
jgi:hypothetical protein